MPSLFWYSSVPPVQHFFTESSHTFVLFDLLNSIKYVLKKKKKKENNFPGQQRKKEKKRFKFLPVISWFSSVAEFQESVFFNIDYMLFHCISNDSSCLCEHISSTFRSCTGLVSDLRKTCGITVLSHYLPSIFSMLLLNCIAIYKGFIIITWSHDSVPTPAIVLQSGYWTAPFIHD